MEMWTQSTDGRWKRWGHPGAGLDAIASSASGPAVVVVIATGPADDEQLVATIRLTRHVTTGPVRVIAASEHPSPDWVESVRRAGADLTLFAPRPDRSLFRCGPALQDTIELGGGICPALHACTQDEATLSVCGRRNDKMVLARHHFERWCFAAKEDCPHWQRGQR